MPGYTHLRSPCPRRSGCGSGPMPRRSRTTMRSWPRRGTSPTRIRAGIGRRIRLVVPARPHDDHPSDGLRGAALQRRGGADEPRQERTHRSSRHRRRAATIGRLAMDVCLFMSQNFGFVSLPDELTTGSSIMPHKEESRRLRDHARTLQPPAIGSQRDRAADDQPPRGLPPRPATVEGHPLPGDDGDQTHAFAMCDFMLAHIRVNEQSSTTKNTTICSRWRTSTGWCWQGTPFREAYKQVGMAVQRGRIPAHTRGAPHPRRQHRQPLHGPDPPQDGARDGSSRGGAGGQQARRRKAGADRQQTRRRDAARCGQQARMFGRSE